MRVRRGGILDDGRVSTGNSAPRSSPRPNPGKALLPNSPACSVCRDRPCSACCAIIARSRQQVDRHFGTSGAIGTHAERAWKEHAAGDGGAPVGASAWLPIPASPARFARQSRSCVSRASSGHLCARMLLAPARLPAWGAAPLKQCKLLAPEAGPERRARRGHNTKVSFAYARSERMPNDGIGRVLAVRYPATVG